jgi:HlyD family secretion protein
MKNTIALLFILMLLSSCSTNNSTADAYGNFESTEIVVSAEGTGKIVAFDCNEGNKTTKNQILGVIDTLQLQFQKEQLEANIYAITSKVRDVQVEINVLDERKKALLIDKNRLAKLFKDSAATQKQIDDINSQIDILDKQIIATKRGMNISNEGLLAEIKPLQVKLKQVEDQIQKCKIQSPINGTILNKYTELGEFAVIGKPLFKISNLDTLDLKAYVSETQLPQIKLGQTVDVFVDLKNNKQQKLKGTLYYIASEAEFTPKVIQTKEERVNLVYAIKIKVANNGELKLGMPAEVRF